jgi:glycerate 2-kinase
MEIRRLFSRVRWRRRYAVSCHCFFYFGGAFVSGFSPARQEWIVPKLKLTLVIAANQRRFSTTAALGVPDAVSWERTAEERQMTKDALTICQAAIKAVDPVQAIQRNLVHQHDAIFQIQEKIINLQDFDAIIIVAFGKASSAMATAVLDQLQLATTTTTIPNITGLVIVKDNHATIDEQVKLEKANIRVRQASHPISDQRSVDASNELLALVEQHTGGTALVVACISGGGSALFCAPHPPLTLADLQDTNTCLLQSGMTIQQINVVRKRLDRGKGGRLAQAAKGSSVIVSMILSDIVGDPLDLIASGPTVPDSSTWEDAWQLLDQFYLQKQLPEAVVTFLKNGLNGKIKDSPKQDSPVFQNCFHYLVGNNAAAVTAAAKEAASLGYNPVVLGTQVVGEASQVAKVYVAMAQHLQNDAFDNYAVAKLPAALIAGG